jgi:hypothetical protein
VKRAARSLLPLGALVFVLGVGAIVASVALWHGAPVPIALGELAIFFGLTCATVGTLAWIVTREPRP